MKDSIDLGETLPVLASLEDLPQVQRMIHELSRWLKTKGIHQWSEAFPIHILEDEHSKQELYVLRINNDVVASVAITKEPGELWESPGNCSAYLHRLAINREQSGNQLGAKIMKWAESEMKKKGFEKLRLVCDATNPFLNTYYRKLEYSYIGTKHYAPYSMNFSLFEKEL